MKNRMFAILCILLSIFALTGCATSGTRIDGTTALETEAFATGMVVEISKYGNTYLDLTVDGLLACGFSAGDLVSVSGDGFTVVAPVVTGYSDVNNGEPLVKIDSTNVEIALSYGDFKNTFGVDTGSIMTIEMVEKGGYLSEYEIRHLEKSEDRMDYSSDEVFANFRAVGTSGIRKDYLYRSCNPALDDARAPYADKLAEKHSINLVVNLADSKESLMQNLAAAPYYASLYEKGNVILLDMGVDFFSDDFKVKLKDALLFIIEREGEGPILIHCNEGKDRAGMVAALLEALAGADMDEIIKDYMASYVNYYGVKEGTAQYDAISSIITDFFINLNGRPFPWNSLGDVVTAYLETQLGLTSEQVSALKDALK